MNRKLSVFLFLMPMSQYFFCLMEKTRFSNKETDLEPVHENNFCTYQCIFVPVYILYPPYYYFSTQFPLVCF